jgi:hypothetical protein
MIECLDALHFSTALHKANQNIAAPLNGNDPGREAESSGEGSDSARGGSVMKIWATLTSRRARWHVVCPSPGVIADAQAYNREPIGQETVPMDRARELTLLDVIQAVSDVAENDQEIIATVVHLISSGQVRLCDEAIEAMRHLVTAVDAAA